MQETTPDVRLELTCVSQSYQLVTCGVRSSNGQLCGQDFSIRPDDMSGMRAHLELVHNIQKQRSGAPIDCPWDNCLCTAQGRRSSRCRSKPASHPAHVENLAHHIWHSHLGFRYMCDRCGGARWSSAFARDRHRNGKRAPGTGLRVGACPGRIPARCPLCCRQFQSEVKLEGHLEQDNCQ
jgi:hypothetical protein